MPSSTFYDFSLHPFDVLGIVMTTGNGGTERPSQKLTLHRYTCFTRLRSASSCESHVGRPCARTIKHSRVTSRVASRIIKVGLAK